MYRSCENYRASGISRRALLQAGTAGIAGLNLPSLLKAAEGKSPRARARHIIFLHQFGGPSHLDTFDMKPDAPDGIRGEFKPIATHQPGLAITEHLPRFSTVLDQFAQVIAVKCPIHGLIELRFDFGLIPVPNRFQKKLSQRPVFEGELT